MNFIRNYRWYKRHIDHSLCFFVFFLHASYLFVVAETQNFFLFILLLLFPFVFALFYIRQKKKTKKKYMHNLCTCITSLKWKWNALHLQWYHRCIFIEFRMHNEQLLEVDKTKHEKKKKTKQNLYKIVEMWSIACMFVRLALVKCEFVESMKCVWVVFFCYLVVFRACYFHTHTHKNVMAVYYSCWAVKILFHFNFW